MSGILGLAFPGLMATANSVPWWIRLIQDGQLGQGEALFAFWLSRFVIHYVPEFKLTAATLATCDTTLRSLELALEPLA